MSCIIYIIYFGSSTYLKWGKQHDPNFISTRNTFLKTNDISAVWKKHEFLGLEIVNISKYKLDAENFSRIWIPHQEFISNCQKYHKRGSQNQHECRRRLFNLLGFKLVLSIYLSVYTITIFLPLETASWTFCRAPSCPSS